MHHHTMHEYLNDTVSRFQDLIKRGILTNVGISFPVTLEPFEDEQLVTLFIFPMASLLTHSEKHSSHLQASITSNQITLYDIDTEQEAARALLPETIDEVFMQQRATLSLEAASETSVQVLEDHYIQKFHRVCISIAGT